MSQWPDPPGLAELTRVFARIGVLSFGGPAAQIALMHRELVETRPWLTEQQYLRALSFCMLLPGPEAMQLATYAGWRLRGPIGGLLAGSLFVLPGAAVVLVLALLYARFGTVPAVQAAFLGVQAAVIAIVLQALLRLTSKALSGSADWAIAGTAFLALFALQVPFPWVIALAALIGLGRAKGSADPVLAPPIHPAKTLALFLVGALVWMAPVLLAAMLGADRLAEIGFFFAKLAIVTFGGAYAVLTYMTQEVVQSLGWLTTSQMMDGLGLAETTPGPLILVTQFVGMLAALEAGDSPLAGAAMTLWVTFIPCFLWIFAGAPYLEWITAQPRLRGALAAITAAVVGVIASLSLWFALQVLFDEVSQTRWGPVLVALPRPETLNTHALALTGLAIVLLVWRRWPFPSLLCALATAGLALGALA